MVNNSTNINKTNNHLSSKDSLNSDGQQFHQYQQIQQPPLAFRWEVIGGFVDIGRIVDHHCLSCL
jgi:hypothetical protein